MLLLLLFDPVKTGSFGCREEGEGTTEHGWSSPQEKGEKGWKGKG